MLLPVKTLIAFMCAVLAGFLFSAPATADPSNDPCQLAVTFLCRFVPMAPELDSDVDLTKQFPPVDPPPELPPMDICSAGCI